MLTIHFRLRALAPGRMIIPIAAALFASGPARATDGAELTGLASERCSLDILNDGNLNAALVARNGRVPIETYEQTNDRDLRDYRNNFGTLLSSRLPAKSWLDVGGGYGFAALDAVGQNLVDRAVVINAQDALEPLRARDYEWFDQWWGLDRTTRLIEHLDSYAYDELTLDRARGRRRVDALERIVDAARERLEHFEWSGRFRYVPGFAERTLVRMDDHFEVLTDLFGGYFYSPARASLLAQYYDRLTADGVGLIATRAVDVRLTGPRSGESWVPKYEAYGPETFVIDHDGNLRAFEDFLISAYPTVFSIHLANELDPRATRRHRVLMMKRDPRVRSLDRLARLRPERIWYGPSGIEAQIPNVVYAEP